MSLDRYGFVKLPAASTDDGSSHSTTESQSATNESQEPSAKRRRYYNSKWAEGRDWLEFSKDEGLMFCSWCRKYDRNEHRNQFVRGCSSMKLESVKRHEASQQHADAKAAQLAHTRPEQAPLEAALLTMEQAEFEQMRCLFNTAYYLVQAERPFRDFSGLLTLQRLNNVSLGHAYSNEMQAKVFVSFIAEDLRAQLVQLIHKSNFFSISIDSSTDKGNIDEEMVQIRLIENHRPVYVCSCQASW